MKKLVETDYMYSGFRTTISHITSGCLGWLVRMWAVEKSGYRGTAGKVSAAVRFGTTHSDRKRGKPIGNRRQRQEGPALVDGARDRGRRCRWIHFAPCPRGLTALPASAASGAPSVSQCNPPDFPTGPGYQVTCTVSVENYTTSTGATSSTVTTSACLAAAGVVYPSCPLNLGP